MRFSLMQIPSAPTRSRAVCPGRRRICNYFIHHESAYHAQTYCHPLASMTQLWIAGVGWAVIAAGIGIVYFWRAEARYGRG